MMVTNISDAPSIVRQRQLLAAMDAVSDLWEERADVQHAAGRYFDALQSRRLAWRAVTVANRTRRRLAARDAAPAPEPHASCPLADCASWSPPAVDHEVIERPGYRIHLPARRANRPRFYTLRQWLARGLVMLLVWRLQP